MNLFEFNLVLINEAVGLVNLVIDPSFQWHFRYTLTIFFNPRFNDSDTSMTKK